MKQDCEQAPIPGPWVSKASGLRAELVRVEGNICWYTLPEYSSEVPCTTSVWLESMRPAVPEGVTA